MPRKSIARQVQPASSLEKVEMPLGIEHRKILNLESIIKVEIQISQGEHEGPRVGGGVKPIEISELTIKFRHRHGLDEPIDTDSHDAKA